MPTLKLLAHFLLLFFLAFSPPAFCQFHWVQSRPLANATFNYEMLRFGLAADGQGNVMLGGYSGNPYLYGVPYGDLRLSKYDYDGLLQFERDIPGHARLLQVHADADNHWLVLGAYRDSVQLGSVWHYNTTADERYFLAVYSSQGQLLGSRDLHTLLGSSFSGAGVLTSTAAGDVFLAYQAGPYSTRVARIPNRGLGTPGTVVSQTGVALISSLDVDEQGNLYLAGSCLDRMARFGTRTVANPFTYTMYTAKYSAAGQPRWVKLVEDITCQAPEVRHDARGGAYFATGGGGHRFDNVQLPGSPGGADYSLAHLDSTGTWQWVQQAPAGPASSGQAHLARSGSLTTDRSGHAYLATEMRGTFGWHANFTNFTLTTRDYDLVVLRYDPLGQLAWVRMGGSAAPDDAHAVAVSRNGYAIYAAGVAVSPVSFGAAQAGAGQSMPIAFVTQVSNALPLSSRVAAGPGEWSVSPNPAQQAFELRFKAGAALPASVAVHDALGRLVRTVPVAAPATAVSTAGLAPGLYLLQAAAGATRYHARLLVE